MCACDGLEEGRRGDLPEARLISMTNAPLTSLEVGEALRAFWRTLSQRSDRLARRQ
jgi:hypothetical protein